MSISNSQRLKLTERCINQHNRRIPNAWITKLFHVQHIAVDINKSYKRLALDEAAAFPDTYTARKYWARSLNRKLPSEMHTTIPPSVTVALAVSSELNESVRVGGGGGAKGDSNPTQHAIESAVEWFASPPKLNLQFTPSSYWWLHVCGWANTPSRTKVSVVTLSRRSRSGQQLSWNAPADGTLLGKRFEQMWTKSDRMTTPT